MHEEAGTKTSPAVDGEGACNGGCARAPHGPEVSGRYDRSSPAHDGTVDQAFRSEGSGRSSPLGSVGRRKGGSKEGAGAADAGAHYAPEWSSRYPDRTSITR